MLCHKHSVHSVCCMSAVFWLPCTMIYEDAQLNTNQTSLLFQITMSQAATSDVDPSADTTPPPDQRPHAEPDSCQDVPAALTPPAAPLQPPLIPDSCSLPQSTEDMTTEDTTDRSDCSEGPADQPAERAPEGQVIVCDQPVSLEPDAEAVAEDVEVCSTSFSTCFDYISIQFPVDVNCEIF